MTATADDHDRPALGLVSPRQRAALWGYLLLVTTAELVTSLVSPQGGQIILVLLLAAMALHAALGSGGAASRLVLALALAPLIRILSLALPLSSFPQLAWYPIVAIPLLIATGMVIGQLRLTRRELGVRLGNPLLQLGLASLGVVLGVAEYFILAPRPQYLEPTWQAFALAGLNLLIFTGFTEELIFRGVLQAVSREALGRWALLYVSLLFGVLHIGYLSWLDVVFVAGVGLLFAYLVRWTGSLLGVTLAHGITNSMLFLVMPQVVADPALQSSPWLGSALGVATAASLVSLVMIATPRLPAGARPGRLVGSRVRAARRAAQLTYAALSERTGLSMRSLAEIEHGMRPPLRDELLRIAQGLQLAPAQLMAG